MPAPAADPRGDHPGLELGRFDRRAAHSYTVPARWYTDPALFERERERIFFRSWQFGCHLGDLPEPGSFVTVDLMDQGIVLVRGGDGEVRGFHNVCQHRAHRILEGAGCTGAIVCPYHAWRYRLDGALEHARNAERVRGFDKGGIRLSPVRVERFLDLVMFNLDPDATPFESQVPGLAGEIRARVPRLDELTRREPATGFSNDELACNWKVLVDNCVECYHCGPAHPAFVDLVQHDTYRIAVHEMHTSHTGELGPTDNAAYSYAPDSEVRHFAFWHVWPNLTFGTFPGTPNFGVFCIDPVDVDHTRSRGGSFRLPGPPTAEERARRRYIDDVLWPEDKGICESVQRGLGSRGYRDGRLMVPPVADGTSEVVSHLFQRLNAEALGALPR